MRKLTLLAGALFLAAPLFAGGPMEGWNFGLGSGFINSSDNTVYATTYNFNLPSNNVFGSNHRLDYGSNASLQVWKNGQIWAGYKSSWGEVKLSYWGYNRTSRSSIVAGDAGSWDTCPNFDLFGHCFDNLDTLARLTTRQFDLQWSRSIVSSDRGELNWTAGLRHSKTSRDITKHGKAFNAPGILHSESTGTHSSSAKGLGLTAGLSGTVKFNDRFSLDSAIMAGYMNGSMDYSANENGTFGHIYTNRFNDSRKNQSFRSTELSLHGNIKIWSGLSAYLGYENRRQDGVLGEFDTTQYYNTNIQDFKTSDLTYSGIVLGVNWKF